MSVFADASTAPEVISGAVSGLQSQLLTVAVSALAIGVVFFAIKKGWGLVKRFV